MPFLTLGHVLDRWSCLIPYIVDPGWDAPAPPMVPVPQRFFLRVALLHPQTEQVWEWTVACADEEQWQRYPVGSWVHLSVHGWRPLLPIMRRVVIVEETYPSALRRG